VIPYGHQSIDDDDVAAVVDVLKGEWLTQGPRVDQLEHELAATVGAQHAVAFANGTAALHGAAAAAGLGPGDLVVTSPLSFVASANCARFVGATPGFVDIDPATLNLDLTALPEEAAAVVAVHYAGLPVDLALLPRRPRVVIEDAAHALGATTPDGPVGSCARSDMCTFSFHPVKALTTGEGGAVTTNDPDLAERLRRFRNHGIVRKPEHGSWYYEVEDLAFNYRLTDLQAALGSSQLAKLGRFVARRRELAARYRELLADLPLELPPQPAAGFEHAYHLFPVRVPDRRRVFEALRDAGIGVQVHYVPIYRHPLYAGVGGGPRSFPHTESAYEALMSLPLFPDLTEAAQDQVVAALRKELA
jgi:UDP-4-amino-4,6-dideoxy-N-acetyl-beta-L-altrosamine transaminase